MKILHITPTTDGYQEAVLVANNISKTNSLAAIEIDGEEFMTGGFIINDTPEIRAVLDNLPTKDQFEFVKSFKSTPFVKFYLED